ncbi:MULTISPECIES: hypothetical protein [unclassified Paenibacillus]|uniref:hypothetical protein n=1 Tax=unclassified Paenibacillus TaxID=185978 RepID=UPI002406FB7E|nr:MULTISPECIES: hypothetical protein [unclassified Paenibacillus]MDF9839879.1 hypothetical protein [Paenibacillus sp. PastF-2]MDF9846460.1 hypothetical protein [Paenibacillus sp. PastM-2]
MHVVRIAPCGKANKYIHCGGSFGCREAVFLLAGTKGLTIEKTKSLTISLVVTTIVTGRGKYAIKGYTGSISDKK